MVDDLSRNLWITRFLAAPSIQYWDDLMLWERFLTQHPAKFILELGTSYGGTALYLFLQAKSRGMGFATFDRNGMLATDDHPLARALGFREHFHQGDMFSEQFETIGRLIADPANHPLVLFCDGGNKPLEYKIFGPLLQPGDSIVVHDWGNEFTAQDLVPEVAVEMVMGQECDEHGSLTRFFKRL